MRVLIVEDEALVALLLESMVKKCGAEVCAKASTGPDAVHLAIQEKPDLILFDINLNGPMTGIDAAAIIKEQVPGQKFAFMSAYGPGEIHKKALSVGPLGYYQKPITLEHMETLMGAV